MFALISWLDLSLLRYQWSCDLQKEEPGEDPEVDEGKL
jgi:hypothetical protein